MKIDYERKPPIIDLGNGHVGKSWLYVDGAPDMHFNEDGTITIHERMVILTLLKLKKARQGQIFSVNR